MTLTWEDPRCGQLKLRQYRGNTSADIKERPHDIVIQNMRKFV